MTCARSDVSNDMKGSCHEQACVSQALIWYAMWWVWYAFQSDPTMSWEKLQLIGKIPTITYRRYSLSVVNKISATNLHRFWKLFAIARVIRCDHRQQQRGLQSAVLGADGQSWLPRKTINPQDACRSHFECSFSSMIVGFAVTLWKTYYYSIGWNLISMLLSD